MQVMKLLPSRQCGERMCKQNHSRSLASEQTTSQTDYREK